MNTEPFQLFFLEQNLILLMTFFGAELKCWKCAVSYSDTFMFSDYWGYCQQAELQLSVKLCLEFIQDKVSGFTFKRPICKGNNSQNKINQC